MTETLVIGFCKCIKCDDEYKFNWHTFFKCPKCKGNQYQKWEDPFYEQNLDEKEINIKGE